MSESNDLAAFRRAVSRAAGESEQKWEDSRRLLEAAVFPSIVEQLVQRLQAAPLTFQVKAALTEALVQGQARRVQDLDGAALKTLTGCPPSKAFRSLCLYAGLVQGRASKWPAADLSSEEVARALQDLSNPFDLLRATPVATVLDLGAGDLSFAGELVDGYLPMLLAQQQELVLHAVDRLDPRSKLGGPLHPGRDRIAQLQARPGLTFRFYGNQDMFDLHELDEAGHLAARYTLVTCWAPATPTFAYEPTRLSDAVIQEDLRRSKGAFRRVRYEGEPALEVQHGERSLIFPSWKFDIRGPVALLSLMARRGLVGVLGAVDSQVFWEILAQLLEDTRYRPQNQPFNPENLPAIFGDIYQRLMQLTVGESVSLAQLGTLRSRLSEKEAPGVAQPAVGFRDVWIRRGAVFPGVPASSTARQFMHMREESPPWFLTLVPEDRQP
ncbi:MAG: hypothetical protein LZF86_210006 [Nitrospira sp.]|nr:MAG: hypothetical protein LZF86_210006 [Nitrospira sp.]